MSDYPEHDKLEAIPLSARDAIGSFLEWLNEHHYVIAERRKAGNNGEPKYTETAKAELEAIAEKWGKDSFKYRCALDEAVNPDYVAWPEALYPIGTNPERWLARFYEIDRDKLNREKQQMLDDFLASQRNK